MLIGAEGWLRTCANDGNPNSTTGITFCAAQAWPELASMKVGMAPAPVPFMLS
jgi:hypothetical protein